MKWWLHIICGVGILWVLAMVAVFLWYAVAAVELDKHYYRQHPDLEGAERLEYLKTLRFQGILQRVLAVLTPVVVFSLAFIVVVALCRRALKQASVHRYKLGPHEIIVHERDLSQAARAAFNLIGEKKTVTPSYAAEKTERAKGAKVQYP